MLNALQCKCLFFFAYFKNEQKKKNEQIGNTEKITQGWEPWLTPMIPALRKLMEEISEFEASIGCIQDSLSYSMELYQQKMVLTDC